jgi:hypothetical protein
MMDKSEPTESKPLPPTNERFQPGTSGNLRGRPKGRKNRKTILKAVANKKITLPDGTARTILELLIIRLRQAARQGKVTEANHFNKLAQKFDPPETEIGLGFLVVPPPLPAHISGLDYARWLADRPVEKPPSLLDKHQNI